MIVRPYNKTIAQSTETVDVIIDNPVEQDIQVRLDGDTTNYQTIASVPAGRSLVSIDLGAFPTPPADGYHYLEFVGATSGWAKINILVVSYPAGQPTLKYTDETGAVITGNYVIVDFNAPDCFRRGYDENLQFTLPSLPADAKLYVEIYKSLDRGTGFYHELEELTALTEDKTVTPKGKMEDYVKLELEYDMTAAAFAVDWDLGELYHYVKTKGLPCQTGLNAFTLKEGLTGLPFVGFKKVASSPETQVMYYRIERGFPPALLGVVVFVAKAAAVAIVSWVIGEYLVKPIVAALTSKSEAEKARSEAIKEQAAAIRETVKTISEDTTLTQEQKERLIDKALSAHEEVAKTLQPEKIVERFDWKTGAVLGLGGLVAGMAIAPRVMR